MPDRADCEKLLRQAAELNDLSRQARTESARLKARSSQLLGRISRNRRAADDARLITAIRS